MEGLDPLDAFNLSASPWERSSDRVIVQAVEWDVRERTGGPSLEGMSVFSVRYDGLVSVHLPEDTTDGEVEDLLKRFLSRVMEAEDAPLDGWSDRFVSSREDGFGPGAGFSSFQLEIDGPFNLSELLHALSEEPLTGTDVPGLANVEQGDWSLRLKAPFDRVAEGRSSDAFRSISGDGFDHVVVELPDAGDEPAEIAQRIEATYADLGIDAEPPGPEEIGTSTACVPVGMDRERPR